MQTGDRWVISGPNGAGKTTLLRLVAGELTPQSGEIRRRAGLRTAWLRQDIGTSTNRTVIETFADAVRVDPEEASEMLTAVGLIDPVDFTRPVAALSVGQRRRLEVSACVCVPSDILLLDEPTNHLSPELVEQLEAVLADYPGAVLTVTHDRRWRQNAAASRDVRWLEVDETGAAHERSIRAAAAG